MGPLGRCSSTSGPYCCKTRLNKSPSQYFLGPFYEPVIAFTRPFGESMIGVMNIATLIEVKVKSLIFYKEKEIAIILLEGPDGSWGLPILAKATEVTSIFLSLEGENPPRPLSHDLIANIVHELKARVIHVLIDILEEPICHGIIAVDLEGKELDFDARPSDAISLAMRTHVPIYVSPAVVHKGAVLFNRQEWAEGLEEKAKLQN
jgi:uncharacterized protein